MTAHGLPLRAAVAIAVTGMVTGTALVVYLVAGLALPVALAGTVLITAASIVPAWRVLDAGQRATVRRRVRAGCRAGLAATIIYDVVRLGLVHLLDLQVRPFEAIPLFGQLLVNARDASAVTTALGVAYHLANGTGFGVAFAVVAGTRGVAMGILWALVLEAAMLAVYPGWLDIRAVSEFTSVSMLGHLSYGATLGWTCKRLLSASSPARATMTGRGSDAP